LAVTGWRGSYTPKIGHPVWTQNPPLWVIFDRDEPDSGACQVG
jgi:hypothetical protein